MDVEALLFPFDNVIMREKKEKAKGAYLFTYSSRKTCFAYPLKFTTGSRLTEQGIKCVFVCGWLVYRFAQVTDLEELIRIAEDARLDKNDLIKWLMSLDADAFKNYFKLN